MTAIEDILDAGWDSGNVTEPTIVTEPKYSLNIYARIVVLRRIFMSDDYMGIISRTYFTPDSFDAYDCWVISSTEADALAMVREIKRICATFTPSGEDKILEWDDGEWTLQLPHRWEYHFTLHIKRSGVSFA